MQFHSWSRPTSSPRSTTATRSGCDEPCPLCLLLCASSAAASRMPSVPPSTTTSKWSADTPCAGATHKIRRQQAPGVSAPAPAPLCLEITVPVDSHVARAPWLVWLPVAAVGLPVCTAVPRPHLPAAALPHQLGGTAGQQGCPGKGASQVGTSSIDGCSPGLRFFPPKHTAVGDSLSPLCCAVGAPLKRMVCPASRPRTIIPWLGPRMHRWLCIGERFAAGCRGSTDHPGAAASAFGAS